MCNLYNCATNWCFISITNLHPVNIIKYLFIDLTSIDRRELCLAESQPHLLTIGAVSALIISIKVMDTIVFCDNTLIEL